MTTSRPTAGTSQWKTVTRVIVLLLAGIVLAKCVSTHIQYSNEAIELHSTLTEFAVRGQTTIELVPLLTSILGRESTALVKVHGLVWGIACFVFFASSPLGPLRGYFKVAIPGVVGFTIGTLCLWDPKLDSLVLSNSVSDTFLLLALMTGQGGRTLGRVWTAFGFGLPLVLFSSMLSSTHVDVCTAYCICVIHQLAPAMKQVSDRRVSPTSISLSTLTRLFISLIFWPTVFLMIIGKLLPLSESAAGGNYNLHYLSPTARRMMTPFPGLAGRTDGEAPFAVYNSTEMYTLYVPGAGFLWSDEMRWAQNLPENFQPPDHDGELQWSVDGSDRILFQDKFMERYPWILQSISGPMASKPWVKKSPLQSGSGVRLFSPTSDGYLCVVPGERVVSEAGYFEKANKQTSTTDEQSITRMRVGALENPSPECHWELYYNPQADTGITLYSRENNCRLATTFRALPDDNLDMSNDTIKRHLGLQLEASCTVNANDASSRLHLIDAMGMKDKPVRRRLQHGSQQHESGLGVLRQARDSFTRGWMLLQARRGLARFRSRFPDFQAVQSSTAEILASAAPFEMLGLELCVCYLLLIMLILTYLLRQRAWISASAFSTVITATPMLEVCFMLVHVTALSISSVSLSSRVASIISLHCLLRVCSGLLVA